MSPADEALREQVAQAIHDAACTPETTMGCAWDEDAEDSHALPLTLADAALDVLSPLLTAEREALRQQEGITDEAVAAASEARERVDRLAREVEALLAEHETPPLQEIHPRRLRAALSAAETGSTDE